MRMSILLSRSTYILAVCFRLRLRSELSAVAGIATIVLLLCPRREQMASDEMDSEEIQSGVDGAETRSSQQPTGTRVPSQLGDKKMMRRYKWIRLGA